MIPLVTLRGQVPGYVVEGQELPSTHPNHPGNKVNILFKAVKSFKPSTKAKSPKKRPHGQGGKDITAPNTIVTHPGHPKI